ncbi:hypothetical protein [Staphylococcus xylosus]|uniref:hypothetical protein n=1 Tax=Staphylococcus xylosus TaxID=1288 RepID=UPI002DB874CD|nr:hypothetical protein [Staphylococcus xylosus]MEB6229052.1 hypothetical protein [Staphylococcus xylosus]
MEEKDEIRFYNEKDVKRIKLHFIYVVIILGFLTLFALTYTFFDKDEAWLFLSFAGVALSLVLSVIAILITLIDVAGQKQKVYEISRSSEELKETINRQQALITQHAENMDSVDDIIQNAFKDHFHNVNEISKEDDKKSKNEKSESDSMIEPFKTTDKSYINSESLFMKVFTTFYLEQELTIRQENYVSNIVNQFKTISVRFSKNKLQLTTNYLYTSPLLNKEYEKERSEVLVKRYLKEEGIISST